MVRGYFILNFRRGIIPSQSPNQPISNSNPSMPSDTALQSLGLLRLCNEPHQKRFHPIRMEGSLARRKGSVA
jgi:hypothetical protein